MTKEEILALLQDAINRQQEASQKLEVFARAAQPLKDKHFALGQIDVLVRLFNGNET